MKHGNLLSKKDVMILLGIFSNGLSCDSEEEFRKLILQLRELIDFDYSFCGYGRHTDGSGLYSNINYININYPESFLNRYFSMGNHRIDPIAQAFLSTFKIQNWNEVVKNFPSKKGNSLTLEAREFGLKDGFTYGNGDTRLIACFSFAGAHIENNARTKAIIEYAVPHFSEVVKKLSLSTGNKVGFLLSARELEVLKWLKEGKSSWDISQILKRSEAVINFHIKNIQKKLDAMNRTHAVVIAIRNKLIDF